MLVNPDSTESFARREAGGKGLHLFQLHREGLPVPAWRVLGVRAFAAFRGQRLGTGHPTTPANAQP
jgi:hypothetical protein